jgi:hypothetical protein
MSWSIAVAVTAATVSLSAGIGSPLIGKPL